ncbi:phage terminase small subunit-related protein [Sporomusa sphaeroides]|uniref:phage terminase small subunit-related protein n=1 Tax=Sporomusa sphaeroides TaxID=47679 RepID=UPI000952C2C9|nr:phage terminase small subunit-related protein [Sporomusa sphaeroides]
MTRKESRQTLEAYRIFKSLGDSRRLKDVARITGKNLSLIKRWSAKYHWLQRIEDEEPPEIKAIKAEIRQRLERIKAMRAMFRQLRY